jgi:gliding motility-associated-like protein
MQTPPSFSFYPLRPLGAPLFLWLLLSASAAHATHIVGGEITYRCLGSDRYEITLIVYRDCYNGDPNAFFDNPASIGVFDSNWKLLQDRRIRFNGRDDTIAVQLSNPCLVVPPNVCVHRARYRDTLTLPFRMGGYTLAYQRCCRNLLIRNIYNPLETGATYIAQISEATLRECNSSAVFKNWPPVAICANEPIDFDHGAADPDGDSLVYRLCTPLSGADQVVPRPQPPNAGPYAEVSWISPPYDLANVLGGQALKIDAKTGFLTGVPNTLGNFVVGICVDEYRNGNLVSSTRRDFQYNVADCGKPLAAFFSPVLVCDTLRVVFKNESRNAASYTWYFDFDGDRNKISTLLSPAFTYPDTGSYRVALIANPGAECSDTTYKTIRLTRSFADAKLDIQYPQCDESGLVVAANDLSVSPVYGITGRQWILNGPGGFRETSTETNPRFKVDASGDYTLRLAISLSNGCIDSLTLPFKAPLPPLDRLADSLLICKGDSVFLFPAADPIYTYRWSPATGLSNPNAPNPKAGPASNSIYSVTVSGNGPCVLEKEIAVKVLETVLLTATAEPDSIFPGKTAQLNAVSPGVSSFSWSPPNTLNNPRIPNPVASPQNTTEYTVSAKFGGNCEAQARVTVFVFSPLCAEPFVFFPTGFSPNGDAQNDVLKLESSIVEEVYWVVYNRWGQKMFEARSLDDAWDGTFKGEPQPVETYGYYLKVRCVGGEEKVMKGNVTLLR